MSPPMLCCASLCLDPGQDVPHLCVRRQVLVAFTFLMQSPTSPHSPPSRHTLNSNQHINADCCNGARAVWGICFAAFLLGLPLLKGPVAFAATTSIACAGLVLAYALPILLRLVVAKQMDEFGPFSLGRYACLGPGCAWQDQAAAKHRCACFPHVQLPALLRCTSVVLMKVKSMIQC